MMLYVTYDECEVPIYMVCNDQGLCLIVTTDNAIANFVNKHSKNLDHNLRLNVGGDPGTRKSNPKIFHHIRKYRH
jgi:hypothetical protein